MGKSKFSSKVQEKIEKGNSQKRKRPVYYDEKIRSKEIGISKGFFVFLIGIIIIGAGTGIFLLLSGNGDNLGNGDNSNTTINEDGLQEGDGFRAHYKLWVADVSGPDGVINTLAPPFQDSTSGDPFESTTGGVIEGFKNNILGLEEGEDTTFTLEAGEGYTSGELANYRLTFWVQIVEIL